MLEAAEGDIEFKDGKFTVAGTDKSAAWGDVALNAYIAHKFTGQELEPGLKEGAFYDPTNFTFPAGCHICEVEIDPETGETEIVGWTAVDDFGIVINPMIVEGQVHGGIAQGVGQALLEGTVYDKDGQLVTGSFMDYAMPRADDLPSFKVDMTETKCPSNPLGIKGCGEAGAIAAPAAVMNAITDAIGTEDIAMPATPAAVWRACRRQPDPPGGGMIRRARCTTFTFHRPTGLRQAVELLGKLEEAKILAGGQTLIPTMKLRLASPSNIIDLRQVEGLSGIEVKGRSIVIGAMTRHVEVANSAGREGEHAGARLPRRPDRRSGGAPPRHASAARSPTTIRTPTIRRPASGSARPSSPTSASIEADEFFKGLFETALEPDEIITKVQLPDRQEGGLREIPQPASRFALVGVFVVEARLGDPRRRHRRRLERRVPRAERSRRR